MDITKITPTNNILQDFSQLCRSIKKDTDRSTYNEKARQILFFINNIQQLFLRKFITDHRRTALLYFLHEELFDIALQIATIDTNYDVQDKDGNTPLLLVSGNYDKITVSIAEIILQGNCLLEHKNNNGENIIIMCSHYCTNASLTILDMVLNRLQTYDMVIVVDKTNRCALEYLIANFVTMKNNNNKSERWNKRLHIDIIVRIFNIYKDLYQNTSDNRFNSIIEDICSDELLNFTFKKLLKLDHLCKEPEQADAYIPTITEASQPNTKRLKVAHSMPIVMGEVIPPVHTNANSHYVWGDQGYEQVRKRSRGGRRTRKSKNREILK